MMDISQEDRDYTISIINYFWPSVKVTSGDVTQQLVIFSAEVLTSGHKCSRSMDLVPRTPGLKPGIKWALKQVRKVGKRLLQNSEKVYMVCQKGVAIKRTQELHLILNGL
jgi:hypothetical protein